MSIHIGLVPLNQTQNDVFTIYSTKSNLINIQSQSNIVFMDIGDYKLGQLSNESFSFSYSNSNIITFDSELITFNRNIIATSNLNIKGFINISNDITADIGIYCSNLSTSNLFIKNNLTDGSKVFECSSNNMETVYVKNEDNGIVYVGGRLGIGRVPYDKNYSLMTSSNIYIDGYIQGTNIITNRVTLNSNLGIGGMFFNENGDIVISCERDVIVNNLVLDGQNKFARLECTEFANISGLLLASNISVFNKTLNTNPFKINQRLINSQQGNNQTGNPISVVSQHPNIVDKDPTIFELSSCGNLILGDFPSLSTTSTGISIINDYVIRGNIPSNRERHFRGYLNFSSNNDVKTEFIVNKSGQISIGSSSDGSAMLEIVNGFKGIEPHYVKPDSIIYLRNESSSNELPFLKCENSNIIKFQITSNGSICFEDSPLNIYKYNIESSNNYLRNIDTCKITCCDSSGIIDMVTSTLSNITDVYSCNIETSNLSTICLYSNRMDVKDGYIEQLEVGSFSTRSFGDTGDGLSVFRIGNDHIAFTGLNIVISKNNNLLQNPPPHVNKNLDKLIIETETSQESANGYTIFGNNKILKLFCKNASTEQNSCVVQELHSATGGFAFVSMNIGIQQPPELYITSINSGSSPYSNPAIRIRYDKTITFNEKFFVKTSSEDITHEGFEAKCVNIGDGILVYANSILSENSRFPCLITNKYGSIDLGRGITDIEGKQLTGIVDIGGSFNKQGGWQSIISGSYIISHSDYGVKTNTSGTIYIQVQGTEKLGNVTVSFIRFSGVPELFTISYHKSVKLSVLTITAVSSGIKITTDNGCRVCWTSIGSC